MATIEDAVHAVPGAPEAAITKIIKILNSDAVGFICARELADGLFQELDASSLPGLNLKEQVVVRMAQRMTGHTHEEPKKRRRLNDSHGSDESEQRMLAVCRKYAAHTVETEPGTGRKKRCAATAVSSDLLMTYAHGEGRKNIGVGHEMEVFVADATSDQRSGIKTRVAFVDQKLDLMLLEVVDKDQVKLLHPDIDFEIFQGQKYHTLAESVSSSVPQPSVSHASLATSKPDGHGNIYGDTISGLGDSGGGVFSDTTGALIGMVVGRDAERNKSIIQPMGKVVFAMTAIGKWQEEV